MLCRMSNPYSQAMTSAEVAAALDKSVKTVTRMVADGRLTPIKRLPGPRGAFLFNPGQVEAILANEPWEPAQ